jgi:peroxiredoxin
MGSGAMDVTFLFFSVLIISVFFLFVLLFAKSFTQPGKRLGFPGASLSSLRAASLSGMVFCVLVAIFLLPRTQYGTFLVGNYYFSTYVKSKDEKAARKAFSMWQRGNSREGFARAYDKMPVDSMVWKDFIKRSTSLYHHRDKPEIYQKYLESLEKRLTSPMGKSAFYFFLGESVMDRFPEKALEYFTIVINLDASRLDVSEARGYVHEIETLNTGDIAPDFSVESIEGVNYSLHSLKGRVVLLDFWSMHCGSCLKEIPALKKLYAKYKSDDFTLLTVSLVTGGDVVDFIEKQQVPGHHILLERGQRPEILNQFNIQYIPTNYVLDREGRIAGKKLRGRALEEVMDRVMGQK